MSVYLYAYDPAVKRLFTVAVSARELADAAAYHRLLSETEDAVLQFGGRKKEIERRTR